MGGGGGGVQSHFCVQPNYSVEVSLCCVVVGVVTISLKYRILKTEFGQPI